MTTRTITRIIATLPVTACIVAATAMLAACENDDTDFSEYINQSEAITNIYIVYNGSSVSVSGDSRGYVTTNGADVTIDTGTDTDSLLLTLSGSTTDGSLLVMREKKYGVVLNGVSISNADGPAINNQCKKSLYLYVADGTTNTLTDGTAYDETVSYQQKGTLFSEGQIYLLGSGTLTVTGNTKNAIASDDYIVVADNVVLNVSSTTGHGIKVNDGLWINAGTIGISVTADAARGIKSDSVVVVTGGNTTISTSGNCVYDSDEADYSSAACIKCDNDFTMTGGTIMENTASEYGGGIYNTAMLIISNGTLSENTAIANGGGIANIGAAASCTFTYGKIEDNVALKGGGLYNESATFTMSEGSLDKLTGLFGSLIDNVASDLGGGVYLKSGRFIVSKGIISSYGRRKIGSSSFYYSGNKAGTDKGSAGIEVYSGCGNAWYKEAAATVTIDGVEQTETFIDNDVIVDVTDWIPIS